MQITYKDKVTLQSNPNIPDENKVTAEDMNEIKSVVNSNEEEQQALNMSVQEIAQNVVNNSQEISNIKEEQTTQNDNIQTNSNNISDLQLNKADKSEIPTDLSQLSNENTKFVNETGLENAISQEKTQRQNADNNLQNQVDTNKTNIQTNATNIATNTQEINTIKAEQTTQNTNIQTNADNITALTSRVTETEGDISDIKEEQTTQNTNISTNATNIESLQEENDNLKKIVSQLPQVEGQGTEITLENTIEAQFTIFDVEGNSVQDGTPSPDNEQPIYSAGDNGSINEKIKNADGTEEQDYSIFVQQPFRSIGDVRDGFVKKSDGWYERHYIARKIFDGTEEWGQNGSTASTGQYVIATTNKKYGILNLLSNSFVTKQTSTENSIAGRAINRNIYITIDLSIVEFSVAKFKAYLAEKYASENPVYVDYELETPLDLPCTQSQIEVLENKPSTYKDFTIIQSEDETPAYLEVSGIRDIDTMFDKVTNAIVSLGGNV